MPSNYDILSVGSKIFVTYTVAGRVKLTSWDADGVQGEVLDIGSTSGAPPEAAAASGTAPDLVSLSVSTGTSAGTTAVTLTGTDFAADTTVTFGGTTATSIVVVGPTSITCVAPVHASGLVSVVVSNSNGSDTLTDSFTYVAARTVTAVSPASGGLTGGTSLTITGTGFTLATTATIGGSSVGSFHVVSDTSITCTSPLATTLGTYDLIVSGGGLDAVTLASAFTYSSALEAGIYTSGVRYRGINVAGAEYGDDWDGWNGQTYFTWRSSAAQAAEMTYFGGKGFNCFRLPISWERLQHTLLGDFNTTYQANMEAYVTQATDAHWEVIVDLHNYNRYATSTHTSDQGTTQQSGYTVRTLGDGTLTNAHIIDVWTKLANIFKGNPKVIFDLMNESHDFAVTSTDYVTMINAQITAIRATGAQNLILVPNTRGSDVSHWSSYSPGDIVLGSGNGGPLDSVALLNVTDSANNFAFGVHAYSSNPASSSTYSDLIAEVTTWATTNSKKLFLSEMGSYYTAANGSTAIASLLAYMNTHSDVWIGWTPWNLGSYSITQYSPQSYTTDGASMSWYTPYLTADTVSTTP